MQCPCPSSPILSVLAPFAVPVSRINWQNALKMLFGTILCNGKRTVCGVLRALGLQNAAGFSKYHRLLNKVTWSTGKGALILLRMLCQLFTGDSKIVIAVDETLERRKGKAITTKGFYRDAVRSTKSNEVNVQGVKWVVMALVVRLPYVLRAFALPFFSVMEPSSSYNKSRGKRHKTTIDWTCQMMLQVVRWLRKPFTLVGDGGFASGKLAWLCLRHAVTLVTRLKMNAALYDLPEKKPRGRPAKRGKRLCSFREMLTMSDLLWEAKKIKTYSGRERFLKFLTGTGLWGAEAFEPVPIRWVLVVDPENRLDPLPLMSTDVTLSAEEILALYIDRWAIEVTFEETREHLGVETQRQWSEKAVSRVTPILMALYSLICMMGHLLKARDGLEPEKTAWYDKQHVTFSDFLRAVRRELGQENPLPEQYASKPLGKSETSHQRQTHEKLVVRCEVRQENCLSEKYASTRSGEGQPTHEQQVHEELAVRRDLRRASPFSEKCSSAPSGENKRPHEQQMHEELVESLSGFA